MPRLVEWTFRENVYWQMAHTRPLAYLACVRKKDMENKVWNVLLERITDESGKYTKA